MSQPKDSMITTLLKKEFSQKENTDCEILVEDSVFRSHKLILCLYSPVIKAMFDHDQEVQKSSQIKLKNFTSLLVEKMLLFLYTEQEKALKDCSVEMFELADFLQIDCLKEKCLIHMCQNLKVSSIMTQIHLAYQHNNEMLKSKISEFLAENVKSVEELEGFDILDAQISNDLLKRMFKCANRGKKEDELSLSVEKNAAYYREATPRKLRFVLKNTGTVPLMFNMIDQPDFIHFKRNYGFILPKRSVRLTTWYVKENWTPDSIKIKYTRGPTDNTTKPSQVLDPTTSWKTLNHKIDGTENIYNHHYDLSSDDDEGENWGFGMFDPADDDY